MKPIGVRADNFIQYDNGAAIRNGWIKERWFWKSLLKGKQ